MAQGKPIDVTDNEFSTEVLDADVPVLVDYWAPWCAPCRMAAPVLEKIAADYEGQIKICKVNIDEQRETAMQYGIQCIPTMHVFKNGILVDQIGGVTPSFESVLREKLESHLT